MAIDQEDGVPVPEQEPTAVGTELPVTVATKEIAVEPEPAPVLASIRLEAKHPLALRWMHWINFPVLFTMIWSGLLIYWNDSDNAYKHPSCGVPGWSWVRLRCFRFFPEGFWKAFNIPYHVTQGLGYHFFFFWIFTINGIAYVLYTALLRGVAFHRS